MRLHLRRRTPTLPQPLPDYVKRRVRLALGRFGSRITRTTVCFLDVNGPRGGVVAHELAHIRNRDILVATVASVLAAAIGHVANLLSFALFFGRSDEESGPSTGGLLAALVAPIAAPLVQLGVSRSREYLADETGARLAGESEGLASALEKLERMAARVPAEVSPATASLFIVSPLADGGGLARLFSTHPPTRERVQRLRSLDLWSAAHAA